MNEMTQDDFNLELAKIPDFEIFNNQLDELYLIDKSCYSQEEIRKLFYEKAQLFPDAIATLPFDTINLLKAFRVRLNIEQNIEDISLIRTFSYPNPFFCKNNGRANLKNKAVFYCADHPTTAILESKPKVNDVIYISVWDIYCDRELNYSAFLSSSIPGNNPWYKTAVELFKRKIEHAKKIGNDKSKQLEKLFEFTANAFVKETQPYPLSSWMANNMIYNYYGIDFIVYPSFATNNVTCNLAFHPNFVDNYFRLNKIYKCVVLEINGSDVSCRIQEVGKVFLTNIKWETPSEDDIKQYFPDVKKLCISNHQY